MHVKGLSELQRLLDQLPAKIEKNVMRGAMRAGAKPILVEAKARVPVESGELRDGLKIKTSGRGSRVVASVRATGPHAFLANFFEYGTSPHLIPGPLAIGQGFVQGVEHPGISARPFLRPAMDAKTREAVVAAGNYIKKRLATKHGLDTADIDIGGGE